MCDSIKARRTYVDRPIEDEMKFAHELFIVCFLAKNNLKLLYNACPNFLRCMSPPKLTTKFPSVLYATTWHSSLLGVLKTQGSMEHCDILSIVGTSNDRAGMWVSLFWRDWIHLVRRPPIGRVVLVQTPVNRWIWSIGWNENWQGKPKYSDRTCHSATLSTTNPIWPELGSNAVGSRRLTAWAMAWPVLTDSIQTLIRSYDWSSVSMRQEE
jgi:hypothetical protein